MKHSVCFRTKGSHKQGMGDVTGSLAIADELLRRGFSPSFIIDNDAEAVQAVSSAGFRIEAVVTGEEEAAYAGRHFNAIVVNQLNTPYETLRVIKRHCEMLVTIDDTGDASRGLADLRINPLYYDEGALCDTGYIPLHPEFQEAHGMEREVSDELRHILVTMGGSDTYGLIPQIIRMLSAYPSSTYITVITGPAFKHDKELQEALADAERAFTVYHSVDAAGMRRWMQWADAAICAAGNTLFEMACCGTPAAVLCGEPHEEETAYRLQSLGFGIVMPFSPALNKELLKESLERLASRKMREAQSVQGRKLIDGKGIIRIVDALERLMAGYSMEAKI